MSEGRATVLLLHGLWMRSTVMSMLGVQLRRAGFATASLSFPSMRANFDHNAQLVTEALARITGPIHLVAHSYGGLVTLRALALRRNDQVRRIVLMGSPIAGSHAGRVLAEHAHLGRALGATRELWRAGPALSLPQGVEVGAIAGTRRVGLGRFVVKLPEPNDGVVTVEETRLPGLADHLTLATSHSTMILAPTVANHVISFLRTGRF